MKVVIGPSSIDESGEPDNEELLRRAEPVAKEVLLKQAEAAAAKLWSEVRTRFHLSDDLKPRFIGDKARDFLRKTTLKDRRDLSNYAIPGVQRIRYIAEPGGEHSMSLAKSAFLMRRALSEQTLK